MEKPEQGAEISPFIVSASRATDIPAFYADWFFDRLQKGWSIWKNPFNNRNYAINYSRVKFIVFWSKNPAPLLNHLDWLKDNGIGCYVQFTLNDYEQEEFEKGIPPLEERLKTFMALVKRLGKAGVIWRFDPLMLTDELDIPTLLRRIEKIGDILHPFAEKLTFSFADILPYPKVKANLKRLGIHWRAWEPGEMTEFAGELVSLVHKKGWNLRLASCGEVTELPFIERSRCIDDRLILRLMPHSPELLNYLGAEVRSVLPGFVHQNAISAGNGRYIVISRNNKDRGQRKACGCIKSKDIGAYDSCPHLCAYCYANSGGDSPIGNYQRHLANKDEARIGGL